MVLLGLLLSVASAACGDGSGPAAPAERPSILFISLDTLRADRLDPALMPELSALAEDSVRFDGARAPMPFTLPSHMTMFTGLAPEVHGVHGRETVLPRAVPTLPEQLHDAGYATVGFATNTWMKGEFGFARGFDHYQRLPRGLTYADRVRAAAQPHLGLLGDSARPGFLFLHFLDPHSDFALFGNTAWPYWTPPEHRRAGPVDEAQFCDAEGHCATDFLVEADRAGRDVPAATIADAERLYDDGLRFLDVELGRLLDELRQRGLYDQLLIVVTSDHGEEFREHGAFIHSQTYDESIAVPLLVKLPGQRHAGTSVSGLVEHVDLLPTLLELVGLEPAAPVQGTSLVGALSSGRSPKPFALSQDKHLRTRFALLAEGHKLIHDSADGHTELYDLVADPAERVDLSGSDRERAERLTGRLLLLLKAQQDAAAAISRDGGQAGTVLTPEEVEELRSIGYMR